MQNVNKHIFSLNSKAYFSENPSGSKLKLQFRNCKDISIFENRQGVVFTERHSVRVRITSVRWHRSPPILSQSQVGSFYSMNTRCLVSLRLFFASSFGNSSLWSFFFLQILLLFINCMSVLLLSCKIVKYPLFGVSDNFLLNF